MTDKGKKADLAFLSIDKFSKEDDFQYDLLRTVWIDMFEEYSKSAACEIRHYMESYGIIKTIGDCAEIADRMLAKFDNREVPTIEVRLSGLENAINSIQASDEVKLILLRFPKRFTWNDMKAIEKKQLAQFKQNNNRIRMLDRRGINRIIAADLRYVVKSFLPKRIPHYEPDLFRDLPTGATADTPNCKALKMLGVLRYNPKLIRWPVVDVATEVCRCSKLSFVPKNYKAMRGICAEPVFTNFLATSLAEELRYVLSSTKGKYHPGGRVLSQDQSRNQGLASKAEKLGLVTIDWTAASDSISASFVYALWPQHAERIASLRSKECLHGSERIPLYVFTTMGFRDTFDLETLGFWACICVAHLWAETLGHEHYDLDDCSVFGDDTIVPAGLANWLLPIAQACGFRVNSFKSYLSETGRFYESCGTDVLDNTVLTTCYWPRKALSKDAIPSLVSLQNRLFESHLFPVTSSKLGDKLQGLFKIPDTVINYITDQDIDDEDFKPSFKTEIPLGISRNLPTFSEVPTESYSYTRLESKVVKVDFDDDKTLYPTGNMMLEWDSDFNIIKYWEYRRRGYKSPADSIWFPFKRSWIQAGVKKTIKTKRVRIPKFGTDGVEEITVVDDGKFKYSQKTGRKLKGIIVEVTKATPAITGELAIPREWGLTQPEYRKAVQVLRMAEFLNSGPKYESALDELLHVSSDDQLSSWTAGVKKDKYKIKRTKDWFVDYRY